MGRGENRQVISETSVIPDLQQDTFQVKSRRITILPHPDADALELAQVDDYRAVVRKGEFNTGDLVVYIPEAAILPEKIIKDLNLEGRLAKGDEGDDGKRIKNRVKAIRLRGSLSQGLIYKPEFSLEEGREYSKELNITKWSPPVPKGMAGDVDPSPIKTYSRIQNIQRYPNVFKENEEIVFTEKLHGTCTIAALINNKLYVSSKGLSSKGLSLRRSLDQHGNDKNVYWSMVQKYELENKLRYLSNKTGSENVYIFGETVGVQDLKYGQKNGALDFRAFDLRVDNNYVDFIEQDQFFKEVELGSVPELYKGPYSKEKIQELATGDETFTGTKSHLREGGVIRPIRERYSEDLEGRAILKVISPDYLLRRGNATEYE